MTFRESLFAARSHIVFVAALLCASALVIWLDRQASAAQPVDTNCVSIEPGAGDAAAELSTWLRRPAPNA